MFMGLRIRRGSWEWHCKEWLAEHEFQQTPDLLQEDYCPFNSGKVSFQVMSQLIWMKPGCEYLRSLMRVMRWKWFIAIHPELPLLIRQCRTIISCDTLGTYSQTKYGEVIPPTSHFWGVQACFYLLFHIRATFSIVTVVLFRTHISSPR